MRSAVTSASLLFV